MDIEFWLINKVSSLFLNITNIERVIIKEEVPKGFICKFGLKWPPGGSGLVLGHLFQNDLDSGHIGPG